MRFWTSADTLSSTVRVFLIRSQTKNCVSYFKRLKKVYSCFPLKWESTCPCGFRSTQHDPLWVCTLLIHVAIASSVSYGSSWMCPSPCEGSAEEYLLMHDITLSTLTISTVYAIIRVSMSARWELCKDIRTLQGLMYNYLRKHQTYN